MASMGRVRHGFMLVVTILGALLLPTFLAVPAAESGWLLASGDPDSLVTAATSEADLIARLGRAAVRRAEIDVDEGEMVPGTLRSPDLTP